MPGAARLAQPLTVGTRDTARGVFDLHHVYDHAEWRIVLYMLKLPPVPSDLASLRAVLDALPEGRREQALTEILDAGIDRLADTLWELVRDAMIATRGPVPAAEWEAAHLPLVRLTDRDRWLEAARDGYADELVAQGLAPAPDTPQTARLRLARLALLHRQIGRAKLEEHDLAQDLVDSKLPNIVPHVAATLGTSHTTIWRRFQRGRNTEGQH